MSYLSLIIIGISQKYKTQKVKKEILLLIRKIHSNSEIMANELYENAVANIKEEITKHQNMVVTLREYGLYNLLQ